MHDEIKLFDKKQWAKESSSQLAKSYLQENPQIKLSEEDLSKKFYEKLMKLISLIH